MSQYQSESVNELMGALAKAQAEIGNASKDMDNPFFKSKYADLASIYAASRPFLTKQGLSVVQLPEITADDRVNLMTQLSHSSGQWVRSWYPVRPVKNDPQSLGSAITYARRYSYSSVIGIAAGDDDDDGNGASGVKSDNKKHDSSPLSQPHYSAKEVYEIKPVIENGSINFDDFAAEIEAKIPIMKTLGDISLLNRANAKTLRVMKDERPELFAELGRQFQEKTNQIGG